MAIPRAAPSGIFGSGYQPAAARPLDIGSIIDAATSGASSLLQGAYIRKVAERNAAAAQEQRRYEREQDTARVTRETERDKFDREKADRDYELRKRELEQKARESGVVPPQQIVPPGGPVAPAGITLPEHYDPERDVSVRRARATRGRTPAEIPGTKEHLAAVTAEAEARARASARFRAPASDAEIGSRRIAIRQSIQEARKRYVGGDPDRMGKGALSPLEANRKALEDAFEIYGEEAVNDAIGVRMPKLKAPQLGTSYTPAGGTPIEGGPAAPAPLRTPSNPAAAAPLPVAPAAAPAPIARSSGRVPVTGIPYLDRAAEKQAAATPRKVAFPRPASWSDEKWNQYLKDTGQVP